MNEATMSYKRAGPGNGQGISGDKSLPGTHGYQE